MALITSLVALPPHAPEIELYTMGQGDHLFERYGHAAICVTYPAGGQPLCYNYGATDFGSPPEELGWDFLRGTSRFWVAVSTQQAMLRSYIRSDRTVWRQRLVLSPEASRQIAAQLTHDALEENRYYLYHHFHDNCTTRVRDIIDRATGGALSTNPESTGATYRDLGRQGLADHRMILVASDFLLGRLADHDLTWYERQFLPRYLREGVAERLDALPEILHQRQAPPFPQIPFPSRHWAVLAGLLFSLALFVSRATGRFVRVVCGLNGMVLGLIGLLLWAVAILSTVPELRYNEALAVFLPTDAALTFLTGKRLRAYAKVRLAGLVGIGILLLIPGILKQPLWSPISIPLLVFSSMLLPLSKQTRANIHQ